MLDLLTKTKNRTVSPVLDNAQACYNLNDRFGLEQNARLALDVAIRTSDEYSNAMASIMLGLARRESWLIRSAVHTFEHSFDYGNAAVACCILATVESNRAQQLVILHRAQSNVELAKNSAAQLGDIARWTQMCDVENAILESVERVVDGSAWVAVE